MTTIDEYDYEFCLWPQHGQWEPAVFEVFKAHPRQLLTFTTTDWVKFRSSLERSGFTLREVTRTPHVTPEIVL